MAVKKRRTPLATIAYGGLLVLLALFTYPFVFSNYKFNVQKTFSLYLAVPSKVGMSNFTEIQNENPFLGDGVFMVKFSITPEGARKLLATHEWKEVAPSEDRDFPKMLEQLDEANQVTCYEWDSPRSRIQVDLVLNAAQTRGVVFFQGI